MALNPVSQLTTVTTALYHTITPTALSAAAATVTAVTAAAAANTSLLPRAETAPPTPTSTSKPQQDPGLSRRQTIIVVSVIGSLFGVALVGCLLFYIVAKIRGVHPCSCLPCCSSSSADKEERGEADQFSAPKERPAMFYGEDRGRGPGHYDERRRRFEEAKRGAGLGVGADVLRVGGGSNASAAAAAAAIQQPPRVAMPEMRTVDLDG